MDRTVRGLRDRLAELDGKGYGAYKSIKGVYDFGDFTLSIDHVQGDPFAEPSRLRVFLPLAVSGFPKELYQNPSREVALRDFLTRSFHGAATRKSQVSGSGKSGLFAIDRPGQQVLERTSVLIDRAEMEVRFVVGLPADGRRILGRHAERILCDSLPEVVEEALLYRNLREDEVKTHVETVEDANAMRSSLRSKGLVAFVADGAVLPRASGIDDRPLEEGAIVFEAPEGFSVTMERPNGPPLRGLGIPKGVTVIVGGGYHGKSTLLRALEAGVYDHLPGDGREACVTDPSAVKIRSEDGRAVTGVTIAPFITHLPGGRDTRRFSTANASGSTSQAASIVEAVEARAGVLLIDEDTSATNFMIRDRRMQELIAKDKEPITPFTDKVRQLYEEFGISTVLVMGGSGDYFDAADTVIAMEEYRPRDVTGEAKEVARTHDSGRLNEGGEAFGRLENRRPAKTSFDASKGRREVSLRVRRTDAIEFGSSEIDLAGVEQLVHGSQLRALAWALVRMASGQSRTVPELLDECEEWIAENGLASLCPDPVGDLAAFRRFELAAALNRLRTLKVD